MAIVGSRYCGIHSPTAADSQYRKASKINPVGKKAYLEYQYLRFILCDWPKLAGLSEITSKHENILRINSENDLNIYRTTLNGEWIDTKKIWEESIEIQLLYVSEVIKDTGYKDAKDWNDFVSKIFKGIGEDVDTVRQPYWVKLILELAELWYFFEGKIVDKRQNNTKLKVALLYEKGTKQSDIAKVLNISPTMVSKILNKNDKLSKRQKQLI
jgi:hypothetical protein